MLVELKLTKFLKEVNAQVKWEMQQITLFLKWVLIIPAINKKEKLKAK